MITSEKIVEVSKKLPGFYAYRPTMVGGLFYIEELTFILSDDERDCEYTVRLYLTDNRCTDSEIDVRYSDGSMTNVLEKDEDFVDIVSHKEKLVQIFSRTI